MKYFSLIAFLLVCSVNANAALNLYPFDDEVKKERFANLIDELRCTVCQNQTIGASNAPLAKDLRDRVYRMIQEGRSDEQIKNFLVERFTDFVLYKPPVKSSTYLLWLGPSALFFIAIIFLLINIRKRSVTESDEIDPEQHKRVQELLKEQQKDNNHA